MQCYGFGKKDEEISESSSESTSESESESEAESSSSSEEEIIEKPTKPTKHSKKNKKENKQKEKEKSKVIQEMMAYYKEKMNKKKEPVVEKKSIRKEFKKQEKENEAKTTIANKPERQVFKKSKDVIKCSNCGTPRKHVETEEYETKGGTVRIKGACEICGKINSKILTTGKEQQKKMILGMIKKASLSAADLGY